MGNAHSQSKEAENRETKQEIPMSESKIYIYSDCDGRFGKLSDPATIAEKKINTTFVA